MTNEELCLRYQAGDADAAEELISKNMGFIRSIALRYGRSEQRLGLILRSRFSFCLIPVRLFRTRLPMLSAWMIRKPR